MPRLALAALCCTFACASTSSATDPQAAHAQDHGLSSVRLERLDAAVERLIDEGSLAGAVVLLQRHGVTAHFEAYGALDVATGRPMQRDALFRICSMSKAVTSVAALMLYEEGLFLLDDPVSRFLPEFAEPRVLAAPPAEGSAPVFEPARRPITIRDLLTHTSGITYGFLGEPVISDLYVAAGITDGLSETELDLAENVRRIAAQPLLHQPGERFSYGLSTDVLGRLLEVASGEELGALLERRVFQPLGMVDTGFFVAGDDLDRLCTAYRTDRGALEALPDGPQVEGLLTFSPSYPYRGERRYASGGAGLVTTAEDYARFCRMLLDGGEVVPGGELVAGGLHGAHDRTDRGNAVRLLSRKTVELMAADHLASIGGAEPFAFGLGLGLAPDPGRSGASTSRGTWSWDGFYTTRFWIDPAEDFVGVIMTQTYPYNSGQVLDRVMAAAYQAIDD